MVLKLLFLTIIFYIIDCTNAQCRNTNPVLGATDAAIVDFPFQVSVHNLNKHWCGGALINVKTIVTSASCVEGLEPTVMTVGASTEIHHSGGIKLQVTEVIRHQQYDRVTRDYDIAIIKFRGDFSTLSRTFNYVRPSIKEDDRLRFGLVSGWGKITKAYVGFSDVLKQDYIPILPQIDCRKSYGSQITNSMLCAGFQGGRADSCVSDWGGPLVYNGTLVGVASWGHGCGNPNEPVVYTNIVKVKAFLQQYQ